MQMTTILKFKKDWNTYPEYKSPSKVIEWLEDHPDCKELEGHFHNGYHVYVFYDDISATEFKLKFAGLFPKV